MNFSEKAYKIVSEIPKGEVMTYKQVAIKIGNPKAYRAVGTLMKNNPNKKKIPCHRVVRSDGGMGGYAFGGIKNKIKILEKEGVKLKEDRAVFDK
jgi:methylated-DNA-[protein]-cysteine S-methyltransferase